MDDTGVNKWFKRLLKRTALTRLLSMVRHTFATMCPAAGMNLKDVQDLFGHAISTPKMYNHVEIEPLRKVMDMLVDYN